MPSKKPPRAASKDGKIDWSKQLRFNLEFAKRRLLSAGQVPPMFIIVSPTDLVTVLADMEEKERTRNLVSLMCYAYDAIGFTLISEAWMKYADDFQPGESLADYERRTVLPSESERRIEVVIMQAVYYDDDGERQSAAMTREIIRDASGKPTGLATIAQVPDDKHSRTKGPTFEILPEQRPTPAQRRAAQEALTILRRMGGFTDFPMPQA